MVDLMQVLEGATYAAFIAGAIFAVVEVRSIKNDRKTELVMRMGEYLSINFQETLLKLSDLDTKDPRQIEEKVGRLGIYGLVGYLEQIAVLAQHKLLDTKFVCYMFPWVGIWRKLEPYVMYVRQSGHKYWAADLEWIAAEDMKFIDRLGMEVIDI